MCVFLVGMMDAQGAVGYTYICKSPSALARGGSFTVCRPFTHICTHTHTHPVDCFSMYIYAPFFVSKIICPSYGLLSCTRWVQIDGWLLSSRYLPEVVTIFHYPTTILSGFSRNSKVWESCIFKEVSSADTRRGSNIGINPPSRDPSLSSLRTSSSDDLQGRPRSLVYAFYLRPQCFPIPEGLATWSRPYYQIWPLSSRTV